MNSPKPNATTSTAGTLTSPAPRRQKFDEKLSPSVNW